MTDARELREHEARWVAKIVGKAVWARMTGNGIDTTNFAWQDKTKLLEDAYDAAMKQLPEQQPRGAFVVPGESVPRVRGYHEDRAMSDAFNALKGMPRDAAPKRREA